VNIGKEKKRSNRQIYLFLDAYMFCRTSHEEFVTETDIDIDIDTVWLFYCRAVSSKFDSLV